MLLYVRTYHCLATISLILALKKELRLDLFLHGLLLLIYPILWMLAIRMLDRIVGSRNVPDYRLAVDLDHSFAFILCPDEAAAERLRARYGSVGDIKFFFDLVRSVRYMSFHDELNHHPRVCWFV